MKRANATCFPPMKLKSWPTLADALHSGYDPTLPALVDALDTPLVRKDLPEALTLCLHTFRSLFDTDKDEEPYFYSNRCPDGTGELIHSVPIGIPHVVGRCLLGVLEGARSGLPFPDDALDILERYCRSSFDNPDHLNSYFDPARDNRRYVEFHNMREGLYGLVALIVLRNSEWARDKAEKMLETLASLTDAEGLWSESIAEAGGRLSDFEGYGRTMNVGRVVEPLLELHALTGSELAMRLAGQYARAALAMGYTEDGCFTWWEQSTGHIHTITSSLAGIAAYAAQTGDAEMLAHAARILERGTPEFFSSWGWGDEVMPEHPANEVSRGEINQTGDVIRAAVMLGGAGYPEYYELAERFMRSMLLPTQHRERELHAILRDNPAPAGDFERDVLRRSIGGFAMQCPNDRMKPGSWPVQTLDITSGAAHAISFFHRNILSVREGEARVNLLFDAENDACIVKSGMPSRGRVDVLMKSDARLLVRLPAWARRESVAACVDFEPARLSFESVYADFGFVRRGRRCSISFDIPLRMELERVDGAEYSTLWYGDQILRIGPRGPESPLPF